MSHEVGELFERYHPVVYRRCLALLRHEPEAEEAVQEVFVAALSGFGRFRLRAAPLTWLYAVATRHCLQRLRNTRARAVKATLLVPEVAAAPELSAALELEGTLRGLSLEELELVVLAWRDELTQEEIAVVTRQSRRTVGKKLARLALRLRREADAEAFEGGPRHLPLAPVTHDPGPGCRETGTTCSRTAALAGRE